MMPRSKLHSFYAAGKALGLAEIGAPADVSFGAKLLAGHLD